MCFLIDTGATHNILFAYVYEHFKNEFKVLKREHIVNQIKETLHRVAPTAKIILYGSEARGDARKDSDIDLLVLLDKDKPTYDEENEVRWPLYELEIKTGVSINPYIISRKSWEDRPYFQTYSSCQSCFFNQIYDFFFMDDVRDKTFFAHVMSENCVIVSKSAVFTHVRRVFPGPNNLLICYSHRFTICNGRSILVIDN